LGLRVKFICFQFNHRSVSQLCEMFGILPCPPSSVMYSILDGGILPPTSYNQNCRTELYKRCSVALGIVRWPGNGNGMAGPSSNRGSRHPMEVSPTEPSGKTHHLLRKGPKSLICNFIVYYIRQGIFTVVQSVLSTLGLNQSDDCLRLWFTSSL
jgi:hypothetical protein